MGRSRRTLQQWVEALTGRQLPAFARSAQRIASKSLEQDSSAAELAALILQDVSMTTRLLRMSNSVLFNPGGGRISTVSRAIIVLGFDTVRDLCLSIAVLDGLLTGPNRGLVARAMGLALHGALQARNLARLARLHEAEEIFVAALLSHLGELALLCHAGEAEAEALPRLLQLRGLDAPEREQAERDLLGFALRDLTARLNHEWRLSGLLARTLEQPAGNDPRARVVRLGNALARCLARGVPGVALDALVFDAAELLGLDQAALKRGVLEVYRSAAEAGSALDADLGPEGPAAPEVAGGPGAPRWNPGDPGLQLAVLRELSQLLMEPKPSSSALVELVMEGLFRGVGLDRVVFALLSPDRAVLREKSVLHTVGAGLPSRFEFAARPAEANPLAWALAHDQPLWVGGPDAPALPADAPLAKQFGTQLLVMPLSVAGTPVGCLLGDRSASGRPLGEETYAQFRLFGQQARLGLAYIKAR